MATTPVNQDVVEQIELNTNIKDIEHKENKKALPRSSTVRFKDKFECWLSMDIHLVDIQLQQELFLISAWLSVLWKDNKNNEFKNLFDNNTLKIIETQGYIPYDQLTVGIRKKLPFKRSFLMNSTDINITNCYLEIYDKSTSRYVWKLYFNFEASCAEHLELKSFPFDSQFLNIKIVYRIQDYYFVSECPEWILDDIDEKYKLFALNKPIKLTVKDSIKTQWNIQKPWMDFRENRGDHRFSFSVIRLRVIRDPTFYLLNGVLPLFLVISCSFASFVMSVEDYLGDKFAYVITLLLTTAAFQYALSTDLPKTSETTLIDAYILWGYCILSMFVAEIAIVFYINEINADIANIVDYITVSIFAIIWLWKSITFVYNYFHSKYSEPDWEQLSIDEMEEWSKDMMDNSKSIPVDQNHFKGTKDK